jgi:hypothetical protein
LLAITLAFLLVKFCVINIVTNIASANISPNYTHLTRCRIK